MSLCSSRFLAAAVAVLALASSAHGQQTVTCDASLKDGQLRYVTCNGTTTFDLSLGDGYGVAPNGGNVYFFALGSGLPSSVTDGSGHSCQGIASGVAMVQYAASGCVVLGTLAEVHNVTFFGAGTDSVMSFDFAGGDAG
jgi:hypothetical protein